MLGILNDQQIVELLTHQLTGRIGCHLDGVTYVVPVNYVYYGKSIYAHSTDGMKISIMRKQPDVCFQVDDLKSIIDWQSVIVWGRFQEINAIDEKQKVLQMLADRIAPYLGNNGHPSHGITPKESDIGDTVELILYKIDISKQTGRFEKH